MLKKLAISAIILSLIGCASGINTSNTKENILSVNHKNNSVQELKTPPTNTQKNPVSSSQQPDIKTNKNSSPVNEVTKYEEFQHSSQNILNSTRNDLQLGLISSQQAETQFLKIRNDARVSPETRIIAHNLIMDLKQGEVDKQTTISETNISQIEGLFYDELISEYEKERRIHLEKIRAAKLKIKLVNAMIKDEEEFKKRLKIDMGKKV
ncbi:transcriptional regulator KorA [Nostoc sp. UHCC 0870]|uniref:transcriptional regulator KorA n=1 Tax=Nostoc sp. UHCC 0870 TaxID=2914041 RepID=UPI001EE13406|nr:transcriptional regulator KorA [Nostoc sp. UHCC 0870]UKP01575.1 transcriptional regulator KorA [Nostoc sp. UHCC 0870]